MSCIGQVLQTPVNVTVAPSENGTCCCNNIITPVDDLYILMKEINATILRGTVLCASDEDSSVAGSIVVVTDNDGNNYVGITNSDGEYSVCVPLPEEESVEYEVQAYCCCSCNGDFCEEAPCTCSCNGAE